MDSAPFPGVIGAHNFESFERPQRDLLPLPFLCKNSLSSSSLSRGVRRRLLRKFHWLTWANDAISSLNEISGKSAQTPVYRKAGKPPADPTGALRELCGASVVYHSDRADIESYSKDRVSWPAAGGSPMDLHSGLSTADSHWFDSWQSHLLRSPGEAASLRKELGLHQAYCDETLVGRPP
eukprot:2980261-Karenia_brevis.AAC.1